MKTWVVKRVTINGKQYANVYLNGSAVVNCVDRGETDAQFIEIAKRGPQWSRIASEAV